MSYTSAKTRRSHQLDGLLLMKDQGLVAASGNAQVSGSPKILDAGSGLFEADLIIDITAIETDTGNEGYNVIVQGSNSPTFASGIVNLAARQFGHSSVTGASNTDAAGRYELGVKNIDADGATYRYLRVRTVVVGTVATGLNYQAYFSASRD